MANSKRATVYFDPGLHEALRAKAAQTARSVSDLVNAAVRHDLDEDAGGLAAFRARRDEPDLDFEAVVEDLSRRGAL